MQNLLQLTLIFTLLMSPLVSGDGHCGDNFCLNDNPKSTSTSCTAKDSPLGVVVACAKGNLDKCYGQDTISCVKDQPTVFTLNLTIGARADRFDVGVYLAPYGPSAKKGYCCRYTLTGIVNKTGDEERPQSGTGLYANLDRDGCGDIRANVVNYHILEVTAKCNSFDGSNSLQIPYCSTWDVNDKSTCLSPRDLVPGTGSKCKCGIMTVGNVVVGTDFSLATLGTPNCYVAGTPLVFPFSVSNPGDFLLTNVQITDTLNTAKECYPASDLTKTFSSVLPTELPPRSEFVCRGTHHSKVGDMTVLDNNITVTAEDPRLTQPASLLTQTQTIQTIAPSAVSVDLKGTQTGNQVAWVLTITNTGEAVINGSALQVTSTIQYTCEAVPSLDPGYSITCTSTETLDQYTPSCYLSNSVTVSCIAGSDCNLEATASNDIRLDGNECQGPLGSCDLPNICVLGSCNDTGVNLAVCDDHIACTEDSCGSDFECHHVANNMLCQTNCGSCDVATCIANNTENLDVWADGCVHRYMFDGGVIIPPMDGALC